MVMPTAVLPLVASFVSFFTCNDGKEGDDDDEEATATGFGIAL